MSYREREIRRVLAEANTVAGALRDALGEVVRHLTPDDADSGASEAAITAHLTRAAAHADTLRSDTRRVQHLQSTPSSEPT